MAETLDTKVVGPYYGPLLNPPPGVTREWTPDDGAYWDKEWKDYLARKATTDG